MQPSLQEGEAPIFREPLSFFSLFFTSAPHTKQHALLSTISSHLPSHFSLPHTAPFPSLVAPSHLLLYLHQLHLQKRAPYQPPHLSSFPQPTPIFHSHHPLISSLHHVLHILSSKQHATTASSFLLHDGCPLHVATRPAPLAPLHGSPIATPTHTHSAIVPRSHSTPLRTPNRTHTHSLSSLTLIHAQTSSTQHPTHNLSLKLHLRLHLHQPYHYPLHARLLTQPSPWLPFYTSLAVGLLLLPFGSFCTYSSPTQQHPCITTVNHRKLRHTTNHHYP